MTEQEIVERERRRAADMMRCLAISFLGSGKHDEALAVVMMANTIQYDDSPQQALERVEKHDSKVMIA